MPGEVIVVEEALARCQERFMSLVLAVNALAETGLGQLALALTDIAEKRLREEGARKNNSQHLAMIESFRKTLEKYRWDGTGEPPWAVKEDEHPVLALIRCRRSVMELENLFENFKGLAVQTPNIIMTSTLDMLVPMVFLASLEDFGRKVKAWWGRLKKKLKRS